MKRAFAFAAAMALALVSTGPAWSSGGKKQDPDKEKVEKTEKPNEGKLINPNFSKDEKLNDASDGNAKGPPDKKQ